MSTNMSGRNGSSSRTITIIKSEKSAVTALLLCLFLGNLGIHRFYVGKIGTGILMLITCGGLGIWTLVDLINIACCNFTDDKGHYLEFERQSSSPFMKIVWILGLILVSILVFVTILTSIILYATSGLTGVARDQLNAMRMHDYDKAYSYTTSEFQHATSLEQFTKFVNTYPALMNNKDSTFTNRSIENGVGTLEGTVEATDGSTTPIIYQLVKENGMWKIQNIEVNPGKAGVTTVESSDGNDKEETPADASEE